HVEDRRRPRARSPPAIKTFDGPRVPPTIGQQLGVLVAPVLPPVLSDERPWHVAVRGTHEHDEQMLEAHEARLVAHDVDVFGAPRLIRSIRHDTRPGGRALPEMSRA